MDVLSEMVAYRDDPYPKTIEWLLFENLHTYNMKAQHNTVDILDKNI